MKTITLNNNQTMEAVEVYGGKELYQGSRREYLEIVVPKEDNTVEELEAALSEEACRELTITEEGGGQFVHSGYVLRGGARVWQDEESGTWYIAVKRYQRTELERTVAQLQAEVAALQNGG